ncbi:hypothetical protein N0V84_006471 [Fusarium piperis]|uniref:NYN domain-containing protein n=1 Tax=Fusarium piperis TaxID=1435070 RepID=A0A9W8WBY5_9HYPO|nr:hypothetical protein N0V84_006471 [Fusarium piperis]
MASMTNSNEPEGDNLGNRDTPPSTPEPTRNVGGSNEKKEKKLKIYIDHPNFWITGQEVTRNPFWRYDAAGLKNILVENTQFRRAGDQCDITVDVYGSVDLHGLTLSSFKEMWENQGANVHQFTRSDSTCSKCLGYRKREKEVDTSLVADSVAEALGDSLGKIETEFVIVSGDRDMRPAVKKIMACGFRVHLWSWEKAISTVYRGKNGLFTLHKLDDFMALELANTYITSVVIRERDVGCMKEDWASYPEAKEAESFVFDHICGVQPYTLDAQGRLLNEQGFYLCAFYATNNQYPDAPAEVGTCKDEWPLMRAFLTFAQTEDQKVKCSVPVIHCVPDPEDDLFSLPTCEAADGTWHQLYTRIPEPGYVLHIGVSGACDYYYPLESSVQAA